MSDEHKAEHGAGEEHGGGGHGGGHGHHGGAPHGGGDHEEHEGAPEWLISFADNVALMMGFFVILLAMNMQKPSTGGIGGEGKYPSETTPEMEDFAIAMRSAFNHPVDINSSDPHEAPLVRRLRERATEGGQTRQKGVDGDKADLQSLRTSNWVQPVAIAYFNDLDSELNDEGKRSLAQAAELVRGKSWMVDVRGHVSATEANGNPQRAMRLAYDRALAASEELVKQGVAREQLRVTGCADNERATGRADSVQGHQSNQRVEVIQTQETMPGDPYSKPGSSGGR
ncbi:MAG TPA: OmpA family protein [Phycisphaerales bacterium]|nr:OmpA family protein [Phycisphaerales bacterium]